MTRGDPSVASPVAETLETLASRLAPHDRLLVGADFDGALAPVAGRPDDALIRPENRRYLRELHRDERATVAVLSGRSVSDVRRRVRLDGVTYAGNHGLELSDRRRTVVHPRAERHRERIRRLRRALGDALAHVPGVVVENNGWTVTVRYWNAPDDRVPEIHETTRTLVERYDHGRYDDRRHDDRRHDGGGRRRAGGRRGEGALRSEDGSLELRRGRQTLDVLPSVGWDGGKTLALLTARSDGDCLPVYLGYPGDGRTLRPIRSRGIVVAVGDDVRPVADGSSPGAEDSPVASGDGRTAAGGARDAQVRDSRDVAAVLRWLATGGVEALGGGR